MLPETEALPTHTRKLIFHFHIPKHIAPQFVFPEIRTGFGSGIVLGAAVPETSVHKNSQTEPGKNKIGTTGQIRMQMVSETFGPESLPQQDFRFGIFAPDPGHILRTGEFSFFLFHRPAEPNFSETVFLMMNPEKIRF
jgi:hypothetical protein